MRDAIEDARAGGATLTEVAQKYGLEAGHRAGGRCRSGKGPDGKAGRRPAELGSCRPPSSPTSAWRTIRSSRPATPSSGTTSPGDAGPRPHARRGARQGRRRVEGRPSARRRSPSRPTTLKAKLGGGADLAKVAADAGLEVKTAERLTRGGQPTGRPLRRGGLGRLRRAQGLRRRRRRGRRHAQDPAQGRRRHRADLQHGRSAARPDQVASSTTSSSTICSPPTSPSARARSTSQINQAALSGVLGLNQSQ